MSADVAISFLLNQSLLGLMMIFWFAMLFEIPRHVFSLLALCVAQALPARQAIAHADARNMGGHRVSVFVVGHNESASLEKCVKSLRDQTADLFEVLIVSDGSSDGMGGLGARLVRDGYATAAFATDIRGGKASALNLALRMARGDIVVAIDSDSALERNAIEELLKPFDDPAVGGACGDIVPRNPGQSLVTCFQAIEYLISISASKRASAAFGQLCCLSGAFSAFRREALLLLGGWQPGAGEDLDVTLRVKEAGWKVSFVPTAVCLTDVPATISSLIRQRLRWERDELRLRARKHFSVMLPAMRRGSLGNLIHQCDFFVFKLASTIAFPVYILWLFSAYGAFAFSILVAVQIVALAIDFTVFSLSIAATGRYDMFRYAFYLPVFSVLRSFVMQPVRLWAFVSEWLLSASSDDDFVPEKVRLQQKW